MESLSSGELPPSRLDLRHALVRGELAAWYQPTMRLSDGVVNGFEALARWHHPRLGLLPASMFVPLAQECGLLHVLDEWMWHEVFRQLARWQEDVLVMPGFRVGVNVSALEFGNRQFAAHLVRAIDHAGVDPRGLMVELSSAQLRGDAGDAVRAGHDVHALGVELALAGIGPNGAAGDHFWSMPFDLVKIDRAFVVAATATAGRVTVRALVKQANLHRVRVLAEGIETRQEADEVRRLGCHGGQGFLWMAAVPADEAEALLNMGAAA